MSLLTLEDLAWLRQYRESLSGWSRYQLAKLRGASCGELMEIAGQVLEGVGNSQIHEQWEYECACAVHRAAARLSASDGEVLIAAGGYADQSLGELSSASSEAVHEAFLALYGE
ncbi:hypothetical protein ACFX5C_28245 [Pseudomonas aeruginosa]|uniref:hypothetical protein n=1 Tax=Pseudomonas aeruginosa TaxID=287 RepID=UPI00366C2696